MTEADMFESIVGTLLGLLKVVLALGKLPVPKQDAETIADWLADVQFDRAARKGMRQGIAVATLAMVGMLAARFGLLYLDSMIQPGLTTAIGDQVFALEVVLGTAAIGGMACWEKQQELRKQAA